MQTLYVDVYFFINFTVDLLACYFSSRLVGIRPHFKRILFCSFLGAVVSIIDVLAETEVLLKIIPNIIFFILLFIFISRNINFVRRIKFVAVFFIVELLLGGIVYYFYNFLDRYFDEIREYIGTDSANRKALVMSLIILFSIGVLKVLIMIFSNSVNEKNVKVTITFDEKEISVDALVDTGNLAKDPMSMTPVMFIKKEVAKRFLPERVVELYDIDGIPQKYKKRIRLIPITRGSGTHLVTGIRVDRIFVENEGTTEEVDFTVAIDKEGGTFGGYEALIPPIN